MSGHSKWAQIHRQKGTADAKRGALFTKLGKSITIAAKIGGSDPDMNFKLRLAIDQAKSANMPKENIERAIKKGAGELDDGKKIESINYEGFGPDGIALIIETLTDNRNRSSSSLKHILSKYGGGLGGPNSVSWMFSQKGIIRIKDIDENLELELIDAGATDIKREDNGISVYTQPSDLQKIKNLLEKKGTNIEYAEVEQIANDPKEVSADTQQKLEKVFEELDNDEDVNNYYTNVKN